MADRRERSQLAGDFLRDGAVLVAVFLPLEFYLKDKLDWSVIAWTALFAGAFLYWGIILEGRDEL